MPKEDQSNGNEADEIVVDETIDVILETEVDYKSLVKEKVVTTVVGVVTTAVASYICGIIVARIEARAAKAKAVDTTATEAPQ